MPSQKIRVKPSKRKSKKSLQLLPLPQPLPPLQPLPPPPPQPPTDDQADQYNIDSWQQRSPIDPPFPPSPPPPAPKHSDSPEVLPLNKDRPIIRFMATNQPTRRVISNRAQWKDTITIKPEMIKYAKFVIAKVNELKEAREHERSTIGISKTLRNTIFYHFQSMMRLTKDNIKHLMNLPGYLNYLDYHKQIFLLQNFIQEINNHLMHISMEIGLNTPIEYLLTDHYTEELSKIQISNSKRSGGKTKRRR
jgi:hypothetical protein